MRCGRKRLRRRRVELGRVAEIVMVLAAAGEARGGRAPTAAERALAAEAELFSKEAVRALVEDLGLSRARDPAAMGYRPHRASIAERILLTKRKVGHKPLQLFSFTLMEEIKEAPVYPTTNVPQTTASNAAPVFQHGASKPTTGLPRNQSTVASFPATSPVSVSSPSGASFVKAASISSIVALPSLGSENIRLEKATIDQANKSAIHTTTTFNPNTIQSSSQAGKSQDKKAPTIQPVTVNTVMKHQSPPGVSFVQQQSVFSNHNAIAKNVQQVLHQPVNHPSWTLPSTEYMYSRLDCQLCKVSITDVESLLVCDACERGIHLKCLQHYGSNGLPKAEWYCPMCVACSKGKPLPPKYGKVTRTVVAPKVSLTSGGTSQRASENPTMKDNSQEVAADGTVINKNSSEANMIVHNSDRLASRCSKERSVSSSGPQKENVEHTENSSTQKVGRATLPWHSYRGYKILQ
ncbi:hypothetical protein ABZP36_020803 [Zizania latifolia]